MFRFTATTWDPWRVAIFLLQTTLCLTSSVSGLSSQELCESKICSGCIAGSLSCQEGGLDRLPVVLSPDIQSIFMIGHKFDSPVLLRDNFSDYPQQTAQLQRLTIRNCGIEVLQPGSFFDLQSVKQLDLSQNRLRIIEPATFAGLRLELLRLDENTDLRLSPGAFRDASIVSLSMNQCGLSTLSYQDLAPLMSMGALTNLHLSGNKLFTFDGRLETPFLSLQSLSLENNPLTCDCRINWLADVFQRRKAKRQTRTLDTIEALKNPLKLVVASPLDGDVLKPICRAPARLVGRPLESLTADDFYCEPPRLKTLEVDLGHAESREISGDLIASENGLTIATGSQTPLVVILRCHVDGSPEMDLSWYQRINLDTQLTSQLGFFDGLEKLTKLPGSVNPKQGVAEIALSSPSRIRDLSRSISSLQVKTRLTEQFVCYGTDPSGSNTTAEVRLHWPLEALNDRDLAKSPVVIEGSTGMATDSELKGKVDRNVNTGIFILSDSDINGFWLQPQYSAIQMISAVVGTFLITCILFLLGCCLLKAHHRHQDKVRTKILLNNHSNNNYQQSLSSTKLQQELHQQQQTPITSLPVYCTTVPSAAHESALTTLIHPDGSQSTAFANQLAYQLSGNATGNNNGVNSTVGGNGPPLTTTYEPVTLSETITSTTYSDSQTYDLPQHPPQIQPPLPPLPPNTRGFLVATPRPVSVNQHGTINTNLPFFFTPLPNDPKAMRFDTSALLPPLLVNANVAQRSHTPGCNNTSQSATPINNGSTLRPMAVNANTLSRLHKEGQVGTSQDFPGTMGHRNAIAMPQNHVYNLDHQRQQSLFTQSLRDVT